MTAALNYLESITRNMSPNSPVIIFFQEMVPSDLELIKSFLWIQSSFVLTDVSPYNWLSSYGTTTLIDRRLPVSSVFRTRYASKMGRDALFVDILTPQAEGQKMDVLRLCNTHLESLRTNPPLRPAQVVLVSERLHEVHSGVVAGDFNAIEAFDLTLHVDNDLKDAYLENGGSEKGEDGWTWGMRSSEGLRQRFGCSRLDKILYCGRLKIRNVQRIGAGIRIETGDREGSGAYVTDHLGLMADLILGSFLEF